jgi:hypothetical protein
LGQKRTFSEVRRDVRFTPESGHCQATIRCPLSAKNRHRCLLDHLVGELPELIGHVET